MLKPILLLGIFGAGVAVGVIAMRNYYGKSAAANTQPAMTATSTSAPVAAALVENPDPKSSATPLSAMTHPGNSTSPATTVPVPADVLLPDAANSSAVSQPIDAGDVFNEMLARASQPGFENQIGDAHRALEREARDEGWANTMEAELQNAMVNEVSTGVFQAEHIECRATMCEVRLSGTGSQAGAIKAWQDGFMGQPFGQRLFLNYGSSITNNDRTDMLMIFRKPPPPGSAPESPPPQSVKKAVRKVAQQP